jgi:hypothetical protein
MEQKIQLRHPEGKKAVGMLQSKYEVLKKAILKHLEKKGQASHTEIWQAVTRDFKNNKIQFEGSLQWHLEWVKLDLEANKIIERVAGTLPQKYALKK